MDLPKFKAFAANSLTVYHIILGFKDPNIKPSENMVGKGENVGFKNVFLS